MLALLAICRNPLWDHEVSAWAVSAEVVFYGLLLALAGSPLIRDRKYSCSVALLMFAVGAVSGWAAYQAATWLRPDGTWTLSAPPPGRVTQLSGCPPTIYAQTAYGEVYEMVCDDKPNGKGCYWVKRDAPIPGNFALKAKGGCPWRYPALRPPAPGRIVAGYDLNVTMVEWIVHHVYGILEDGAIWDFARSSALAPWLILVFIVIPGAGLIGALSPLALRVGKKPQEEAQVPAGS
jgi:hypothetical protein